MLNVLNWLRTRDADLSALRRAGRAAIVMPALFALCDKVVGNPAMATFASFGALSGLLFVDFSGAMGQRLAAQTGLVAAGAVLVTVGTLASRTAWLAVLVTLVVGFLVLFAGVVSSVLASASTALLVAFVLPVTLPAPVSALPDRLAGWLLAGAASVIAVGLLWPAPRREPLRLATATACALLARRLRSEVDCVRGGFGPVGAAEYRALSDEAGAAVAALRTSFFGTPYRPTGLSTSARTLVRLVDQVVWLDAILERMPLDEEPGPTDAVVCDVKVAAATLLEHGAASLESVADSSAELERDLRRLEAAREAMETAVTGDLPLHRPRTTKSGSADAPGPSGAPDTPAADDAVAGILGALEPSFRAQEMSFAISAMATNIGLTVAALRRGWWDHVLGRGPSGVPSFLSSAQERAGAHVERHSVWLHNSVRGAIALALAVLLAESTGVQHSFWVVLGTLAVLRSNALSTGQNALRGLLGTGVGFVIGGGIVYGVGTHTTALWLLLPFAVAFAGLAPAAISFAAGQAGFTTVLLILYNIIEPAGWQIGLVRVEDVALGCGVSLVAGALFWPRGAGRALGQALADAYEEGAHYLRGAIQYGVARCDAAAPAPATPQDERRRAAAASRRLDDAFRGFLAERGTKHIPLADVTTLITGVAALRLTSDAILDLWERETVTSQEDRTAARGEILYAGTLLVDWYEAAARALAGSGAVPDRAARDEAADGRLLDAVRRDLTADDGRGTSTAVKMIWTFDHIDAARRLQAGILRPARAAATLRQGRGPFGPRPALRVRSSRA
ncbi:FUSC family protein [Streptomyces sp. NPDC003300]|uniref:FUSC family protein n=1 Tax=unclassified Streptomyces TaxID=2593676 RepID=UPI0033BAB1B4